VARTSGAQNSKFLGVAWQTSADVCRPSRPTVSRSGSDPTTPWVGLGTSLPDQTGPKIALDWSMSNTDERWVELKILVPYDRYRHPNGHAELREQIEAETPGVMVPPLSMKWMRAVSTIERHYQAGQLPKNAALVIFKVPGKVAAQKLLVEMWVAGNKFHALPYIPDKADTLCGACGWWGHSEFQC